MWLLAAMLLIVMLVIKIVQTITRPDIIKRQFNDPVMAQFFGAPPMALLTIAGGTLLMGHHIFPPETALTITWTPWFVGILGGLLSAVIIPFRLFTHYEVNSNAAFGGWLMPVVPPMVSATIGAMLIPYAQGIVLGPLGQSITAIGALGTVALAVINRLRVV